MPTSFITATAFSEISFAGIDPAEYSAHSLRAGMVTQAALNGAEKRDIRTITGHKSDTMIDRYTRVVDQWKNNATAGLMG